VTVRRRTLRAGAFYLRAMDENRRRLEENPGTAFERK
jgi:hypothetical protein